MNSGSERERYSHQCVSVNLAIDDDLNIKVCEPTDFGVEPRSDPYAQLGSLKH